MYFLQCGALYNYGVCLYYNSMRVCVTQDEWAHACDCYSYMMNETLMEKVCTVFFSFNRFSPTAARQKTLILIHKKRKLFSSQVISNPEIRNLNVPRGNINTCISDL